MNLEKFYICHRSCLFKKFTLSQIMSFQKVYTVTDHAFSKKTAPTERIPAGAVSFAFNGSYFAFLLLYLSIFQ